MALGRSTTPPVTPPAAPPVPPAAPAVKATKIRNKLPELDLSALAGDPVIVTSAETMHAFRPQRADRSPQQRRVDAFVHQAYDSWVKAGRPEKWTAEKPHGVRLNVDEAQLASLQAAIRKGGDHYNFRIRFGLIVTAERKNETTGKTQTVAQFVFIATDRSNTSDPAE